MYAHYISYAVYYINCNYKCHGMFNSLGEISSAFNKSCKQICTPEISLLLSQ